MGHFKSFYDIIFSTWGLNCPACFKGELFVFSILSPLYN